MAEDRGALGALPEQSASLSEGALAELAALGLGTDGRTLGTKVEGVESGDRAGVGKRTIHARDVLNEPIDYAKPHSFTRGLRIELGEVSMLLLSGTASVGEGGETLYPGDFPAQMLRTIRNLTRLLVSEGASWHDVARTTCFLRDIERDYDSFNEIRTTFMAAIGLDPLPASTAVQAHLCRSDLLVEIEAIAFVPRGRDRR